MAVTSGQETVIDENDIDKEKTEIDRILDANAYSPDEKEKIMDQCTLYEEMYGEKPSKISQLDNLFFITDARVSGNDNVFFFEQLANSNDMYLLAIEYPQYYKIEEQYGYAVGSKEYTELLSKAYADMTILGNLPEDALMEAIRQLQKQQDLYNALAEQSITEILANLANKGKIPLDEWHAFNDQINKIVTSTGTVDENIGNISAFVNWERNAFNRAPATFDAFLAEVEGGNSGWSKQIDFGSGYHMNGKEGKYSIKFYHKSGSEAIYNSKTGTLLLFENDPHNMSTYNFGSQDGIVGILPWEDHTIYDVNPYKKWDTYGDFKMEPLKNTAALENSFDAMWSQSDVRKDAVKAYEDAIKK